MLKVDKPVGVNQQRGRDVGRQWSGPLVIGIVFAVLATALSVVGLVRTHNLSLRNIVLAALLGGGAWGLVSWAVACAVVQVEEDVESGRDEDGGSTG